MGPIKVLLITTMTILSTLAGISIIILSSPIQRQTEKHFLTDTFIVAENGLDIKNSDNVVVSIEKPINGSSLIGIKIRCVKNGGPVTYLPAMTTVSDLKIGERVNVRIINYATDCWSKRAPICVAVRSSVHQ